MQMVESVRSRAFRIIGHGDGDDWERTPLLLSLLRAYECRRIFEFGTFRGWTATNIVLNIENSTVVTLDKDGSNYEPAPDGRITRLVGDSRSFDFRPYWGRFDFVFVDGDHSEMGAFLDTANGLLLLDRSRTSVICWDNYQEKFPGVERAIRSLGLPVRRELNLAWLEIGRAE